MTPDPLEKQFFKYLGNLLPGNKPVDLTALEGLSAAGLLTLAGKIETPLLPLFIQILKSSGKMFEKIMGDHDPENKAAVDSFFERYREIILSGEAHQADFNPLLAYLPREVFADLTFVQSRQNFFERQQSHVINDYFENIFGESTQFIPGEEGQAWEYFWGKVVKA